MDGITMQSTGLLYRLTVTGLYKNTLVLGYSRLNSIMLEGSIANVLLKCSRSSAKMKTAYYHD